jgi:hypothetical protein
MRLWTLHPQHLDPNGLTALWREALLARQVLLGRTRGYRFHPQLDRFRAHADSAAAIAFYLRGIAEESVRRGYRFDLSKVDLQAPACRIVEASGQLLFEWTYLLAKLAQRSPPWHERQAGRALPAAHPLFEIAPGPVAPWERAAGR